jgi:hypothetical protein
VARPVTTLCIDCKEEREKEEQAQSAALRGSAGASVTPDDSVAPADESTSLEE